MTWPPTNNFDNFITKLLSGSLPNYDPKDLEANNSENTRYAGHCLLWSKTNLVFKTRIQDIPMRALFMMQLRFDGKFGYPGGFIDPGESIVEGVNREMNEEMSIDLNEVSVTEKDFVFSVEQEQKDEKFGQKFAKLKLYFFVKEIDEATFNKIETNSRNAEHFGTENLGVVRAPLHRWKESDGFPKFLTNAFAGTGKAQLLMALYKTQIMTEDEIIQAYQLHHQQE